jgi:hypothetical protein
MYRVTPNNSGKYHNVVPGARYCLTRKSAIELANLFLNDDCDITIEKFIRIPSAFMWSDAWEETKIVFDEDDEGNLTARKANRHDF